MPHRWLEIMLLASIVSAVNQNLDAARTGSGGNLARGEQLFQSWCARCHGLKATGGIGPSLIRARFRRAADDDALFALIKEGIPGSEMPGSWMMTDREIRCVAGYVRSLGRAEVTPLPGDSSRGKVLYGKSDCAKCHSIRGQGGTQGPDLTDVGGRRGASHLRQVLLDPGSSKLLDTYGYLAFLNVQVATRDGRVLQGLRVNEDSFTIQLRGADNTLYSIEKRDIAEMKREPDSSVMPGYGKAFSSGEIDDLVAFLSSLRGD